MTKIGRPRVLDEGKRREICALVSAGAGIESAAKYVGCSRSTVYREAKQDEEFRRRLQRAKATFCLTPLQALRQAYQEDWRAAAWMLERTDPEQYGRKHRNTFGRRELKALTRDLLAIVRQEIEHPVHRDCVMARMRATLNYAMRHAWDQSRTGGALDRALQSFEKMNPQSDDWLAFDFNLDFPKSKFAKSSKDSNSFATPEGSEFRKVGVVEELLDSLSARIQDSNDDEAT